MIETVVRTENPLTWNEIAAVADGANLLLSDGVRVRMQNARAIVEAIVEKGIRGYGINTGVGALSDVIISRENQQALSRNIILSHACGVGQPFGIAETRAIMAAQINNFAHGASGIRLEVVDLLLHLLANGCTPVVPRQGSVGYICHTAAIGLVLIGKGYAIYRGERLTGHEALSRIGRAPLTLQAKEGLSLVNGTPCATGLASLAVARAARLVEWADLAAAATYENLGTQADIFAEGPLTLRVSDGLGTVGSNMRRYLSGSGLLSARAGTRTQDPLSLRGIPHVHGAARDALATVSASVDRELASVTDNPAVSGTTDMPMVHSQAHAIGASIALSMDHLAVAVASLGAISERRIDRLVNPHVSGLPAFLADGSGIRSGYMIAQYSAASLVNENRRLAAPASLDGGITSALQEDALAHATPAAIKALDIAGNVEFVLAIELLASAQAYECQTSTCAPAPETERLRARIRSIVPTYADDRPMNEDIVTLRDALLVKDLRSLHAAA
jgi:histidine ammonia-lyase